MYSRNYGKELQEGSEFRSFCGSGYNLEQSGPHSPVPS